MMVNIHTIQLEFDNDEWEKLKRYKKSVKKTWKHIMLSTASIRYQGPVAKEAREETKDEVKQDEPATSQ